MSGKREPNIVIREAWGDEKEVGFRGIEHIDMPVQEMRDLIDKYGDTLIELQEVSEDHDGIEFYWQAGRVVANMDDRAEFAKLARYSDLDIDDWTLKRYANFYRLFPDHDFDSRISKSVYIELSVGERLEVARDAYDNLVNYSDGEDVVKPTVYEVRSWFTAEDYSVKTIVKTLKREAKGQTSNLDEEKLLRGVKHVYILEGIDPEEVTKEDVKEATMSLSEEHE